MFWRELIIQMRVIGALIMREGLTQHGRNGIGFLWVVAEPLMFATPVLIMWSMVRSPYEHGVQMMAMAWSGYLPILLFRHLGGRILGFIRVAKNSVRGSQKPRTEITHQFLECFRLTRFQTFYQGSIFAFGH